MPSSFVGWSLPNAVPYLSIRLVSVSPRKWTWFAGACTISSRQYSLGDVFGPSKKGFCVCVGVVQHGGIGMLDVAAQ